MFMAALWSRLCVVPQLHVSASVCQREVIFYKTTNAAGFAGRIPLIDFGKGLSLRCKLILKHCAEHTEAVIIVDLPSFREPVKPRRLMSSTNTTSYRLAIAALLPYGRNSCADWLYVHAEAELYVVVRYSF